MLEEYPLCKILTRLDITDKPKNKNLRGQLI